MGQQSNRLKCPLYYFEKLQDSSLFRNSWIERVQALCIPWLTSLGRVWRKPTDSQVVEHLTLFEKFLSYRCRNSRRMTFSVAFKDVTIPCRSYVPHAICELANYILQTREGWQNQPLNVTVNAQGDPDVIDPRRSTDQLLKIAIVEENESSSSVCTIDLSMIEDLTQAETLNYVNQQLKNLEASEAPVSIVLQRCAADSKAISGNYIDYPGAWLRIAPNAANGGLIASADHLVLDGFMFQNLLLRVAKASAISNKAVSRSSVSHSVISHTPQEPLASLRMDQSNSMTEVFKHIVDTLEEFGLQLRDGKDSVQLLTIQESGPDASPDIAKYQRRVFPVIANLEGTQTVSALRERIQELNTSGWCSLGALVWERMYRSGIQPWLMFYMERMGHLVPCLRAVGYLKGAAVLSCIPAAHEANVCASTISHLTSLSMRPQTEGPLVSLMLIPNQTTHLKELFITVSGAGTWDDLTKLEAFRNSLLDKLQLSIAETKQSA